MASVDFSCVFVFDGMPNALRNRAGIGFSGSSAVSKPPSLCSGDQALLLLQLLRTALLAVLLTLHINGLAMKPVAAPVFAGANNAACLGHLLVWIY